MKYHLERKDRMLCNCLAVGLAQKIEETLKNSRSKYAKVFVFDASETDISDDEKILNSDTDDEVEYSDSYSNSIRLRAKTISYENLRDAASSAVQKITGYQIANLHRKLHNETDNELYIIYKDVNDIVLSDWELDGFEPSRWYSEEFRNKFSRRNIAVLIKEYKNLVKSRDEYLKSADRYNEEIAKFKEGLSPEELLAIEALGN